MKQIEPAARTECCACGGVDKYSVNNTGGSVHREHCRPQGRRAALRQFSLVRVSMQLVTALTFASYKGIALVRFWRETVGVRERGM